MINFVEWKGRGIMEERHINDKMRVWRVILGLAFHPGSFDSTISCAVLSTLPVVNDTGMT